MLEIYYVDIKSHHFKFEILPVDTIIRSIEMFWGFFFVKKKNTNK